MSVLSFLVKPFEFRWRAQPLRPAAQRAESTRSKIGNVYLVGAGPGDAELLTVKALRLLQQADVVLYDALVSADVLALIPRKTPRQFVGKRVARHSFRQQDINQTLVDLALAGQCVVRLKGGDPSLFGRVKEEADALTAQQIPFCIVPGITAASAASAYTGIPLTCRGVSQSVSLATSSLAGQGKLRAPAASADATQVFYMGSRHLEGICQQLLDDGLAADTPIALIDQVSTQSQCTLTGTLADIHHHPQRQDLRGPTLIIVGEVIHQRMAVNTHLLGELAQQI